MKRNGKKAEPVVIEYDEAAQKKRKIEKKRKTVLKYKLKYVEEKREARLPKLAAKQELLRQVREIDSISQKTSQEESVSVVHKNQSDGRKTVVTISTMDDLDEFVTLKKIQDKAEKAETGSESESEEDE